MPSKCLVTFYNGSVQRIGVGCLDGPYPLSSMRMSGDINMGTVGSTARGAYINFNLVPYYMPYNSGSGWIRESNYNLYVWKDGISSGQDNQGQPTDVTFDATYGRVGAYSAWPSPGCSQYGGTTSWYLDCTGPVTCSLTQQGKNKMDKILAAANTLRGYGWGVGFGLTNEPNNLLGYNSGNIYQIWWPMTARVYAAVYQTLVGYIKDRAKQLYAWDPVSVGFGDCSYYSPCICDPLDEFNRYINKVPYNPPASGDWLQFPDTRYPNLFLYYFNDVDHRPGTSPIYGLPLAASFITYHSHEGGFTPNAGSFVERQRRALSFDPNNPNDPLTEYSFKNSKYYTGTGYYGTVGYGLTEWSCEAADTDTKATAFLQDVWGNPTFQGLSSVLRTAYWYCDFCKGANRRGIFMTKYDMDPFGECMVTYPSWTTQQNWDAMGLCPGELVPVCGQALKEAHYP